MYLLNPKEYKKAYNAAKEVVVQMLGEDKVISSFRELLLVRELYQGVTNHEVEIPGIFEKHPDLFTQMLDNVLEELNIGAWNTLFETVRIAEEARVGHILDEEEVDDLLQRLSKAENADLVKITEKTKKKASERT